MSSRHRSRCCRTPSTATCLIGYCNGHGEMILVFEYMSRGTLRDHLYNSDQPPLMWQRRVESCLSAARGLHDLHAWTLDQIVDSNLAGKVTPECLCEFGEIAISCIHENHADRPLMNDIVSALELIVKMGEDDDEIALANDTSKIRSSCVSENSNIKHKSVTMESVKFFSQINGNEEIALRLDVGNPNPLSLFGVTF